MVCCIFLFETISIKYNNAAQYSFKIMFNRQYSIIIINICYEVKFFRYFIVLYCTIIRYIFIFTIQKCKMVQSTGDFSFLNLSE